MKTIIFFLVMFVPGFTIGQTNVSGGIYSNTTWTKANSPYIVTDTVVVFPGVTLTIQPGVKVKFYPYTRLEIRQASLIATGTGIDSITFTSNSTTPAANNWGGIFLNGGGMQSQFDYCNLLYADVGIRVSQSYVYSLSHSNFKYNNTGYSGSNPTAIYNCNFYNNINYGIEEIYSGVVDSCKFLNNGTGISRPNNIILKNSLIKFNQTGINAIWQTVVDSCIVSNNQYGINNPFNASDKFTIKNSNIDSNSVHGILMMGSLVDSVFHCRINNNGIGIETKSQSTFPRIIKGNIIENNTVGIRIGNSKDTISCNKVCNNTSYGLEYLVTIGNNGLAANNYWCSSDSAAIAAMIFDGYDDVNYFLINFMPFDTAQCYLTLPVNENEMPVSIMLFPNPSSGIFSIKDELKKVNAVEVYNVMGERIYHSDSFEQKAVLDLTGQPNGIYFYNLISDNKKTSSGKLIIKK